MIDKKQQGILIAVGVVGVLYILFGTNLTTAPQDVFAGEPGIRRLFSLFFLVNSKIAGRLLVSSIVVYAIGWYFYNKRYQIHYDDAEEQEAHRKAHDLFWTRVLFLGAGR